MTTTIKQFIEEHGIETKLEGDELFVQGITFKAGKEVKEWVSIIDWNITHIYSFLGYSFLEN